MPNSDIIEITGLTRQDLGQLFKDNDPTNEHLWHYNAKELKTIYSWLGGGHDKHAHPQATRLLVTTILTQGATGLNITRYDVLKSHTADFEREIEDLLLGDLYSQVLNKKEQVLFATMALYRDYVSVDHVEAGVSKNCPLL